MANLKLILDAFGVIAQYDITLKTRLDPRFRGDDGMNCAYAYACLNLRISVEFMGISSWAINAPPTGGAEESVIDSRHFPSTSCRSFAPASRASELDVRQYIPKLTCSENVMRKIVSFMHTSLDGFVADNNGGLGWASLDDELFSFVGARISETDSALYGRVTYQMMEAYWPTVATKLNPSAHEVAHSKWYAKVKKIVLSQSLDENELVNTKVIGKNLTEEITSIKKASGNEILIFGSPTAAHALMAEDLIDEYWLIVHPVLLSAGTPLFNKIKSKKSLSFISSKVLASGVVCLKYICN